MKPPTVTARPPAAAPSEGVMAAHSRLVIASLLTTCLALSLSLVMMSSLVLARLGAEPAGATASSSPAVTVFGDASAPRSAAAAAPSGLVAALAASNTASSPAADAPLGVFGDDVIPATPQDPDTQAVELGMRFTPRNDGTISAIRFFRAEGNAGPHVGSLWGPNGEVLARVAFPDDDAVGWRSAALSPAVGVRAGMTYTVSYHAGSGRYSADEEYFTAPREAGGLSIPAGAGVFAYGPGAYPTEVYRNSNYYVDVAFQAVPEPAPTPGPTASPGPSASSEPEPPTRPEPTAPAAAAGVFGDDVAPASPVDPDRRSVELGMRFTPKVSGSALAVRFFRSASNTGPHVGSLWDDGGRRLAQVRFADGGTGWQSSELSQPVALTAGRTYVVSYVAPSGRYSADEHYFDSGIENEYFSVPAGAGVYAYGSGTFPTENFRNSNYYVDVRFAPATDEGAPTPTPTTDPRPEPTLTPTPVPTLSPGPSPTATPTPSPTSGPPATSVLDLPTEAWWGGPAYYGAWPKARAAGWTDPSFFPIAVFFGKPSHAAALADLGINTYMGAEHDGSTMSSITSRGISVLAQSEWTPREVGDDARVVGWHVSDECDMGYSGCTEDWSNDNGELGRLEVQRSYVRDFRSLNDGRFLQANFGNGVLGTWWAPTTMDDHLALVDASSVDKYAYTSPHVNDLFRDSPSWPEGKDPASAGAYGWQQDRMESFMSPAASKPNWVFVETARPFLEEPGARRITGDQIEGAVWNAIIHGAAGISYFQHNNDPACGTYSLVECEQSLRTKVRQVNADVRSLAPVINSPSYVWSFGGGLETSLKAYDGDAYILAMTDGGSGARTFTLPAGLSGTVEVVGEGRTLRIEDGTFTDSFASEHDHHIYRVALK